MTQQPIVMSFVPMFLCCSPLLVAADAQTPLSTALQAIESVRALSEVAIYNYPLTLTDITNHTSQIWTPASFVTQANGSQFNPNAASVRFAFARLGGFLFTKKFA